MKKSSILVTVAVAAGLGLSGCGQPNLSNTQEKGLIGAAGGALVGQAIGGNTKSTLIGAAAGAVAGAAYGHYQDTNEQ